MTEGEASILRTPVEMDLRSNVHPLDHMQRAQESRREKLLVNYRATPRERIVWERIASGESSKEIANKLDLSINTVKFHTDNIAAKVRQEKGLRRVNKVKLALLYHGIPLSEDNNSQN